MTQHIAEEQRKIEIDLAIARQFEMELLRHIGQGVLQFGDALNVIRVAVIQEIHRELAKLVSVVGYHF